MMLSTIKSIITEAPTFWRHLDGIINIYKPAGVSMKQVQTAIITNLCRGEVLQNIKLMDLFTK